jgi:hypothetical protein
LWAAGSYAATGGAIALTYEVKVPMPIAARR